MAVHWAAQLASCWVALSVKLKVDMKAGCWDETMAVHSAGTKALKKAAHSDKMKAVHWDEMKAAHLADSTAVH